MKKSILIAEDQKIVSEGLRALISQSEEFTTIGLAEDGLEAIRMTLRLCPDIVLMDLSMPKMNGVDATREIKRRLPCVKVVVLTALDSDKALEEARRNGADGYLLKRITQDELIEALRSVLAGKSGFRASSRPLPRAANSGQARPRTAVDRLTRRERQILKLIAEGYKNRQISEELCISIKTVENHRANLMRKLDLHSTAQVTGFAFKEGLIGLLDEELAALPNGGDSDKLG